MLKAWVMCSPSAVEAVGQAFRLQCFRNQCDSEKLNKVAHNDNDVAHKRQPGGIQMVFNTALQPVAAFGQKLFDTAGQPVAAFGQKL